MPADPKNPDDRWKLHRVRLLAQDGLTHAEIAQRLNCGQGYVRQALSRLRRRGEHVPAALRLNLTLSRSAHDRLLVEAHRKSKTPFAIASGLIETICADNLFQAVLDD